PFRCLPMSSENCPTDPYLRSGSFLNALRMMLSTSPFSCDRETCSRVREAASEGETLSAPSLNRPSLKASLGFEGWESQMARDTSSGDASLTLYGRAPVSNS